MPWAFAAWNVSRNEMFLEMRGNTFLEMRWKAFLDKGHF